MSTESKQQIPGKKIIEFACYGNSGRSPIAEAAARQWLKEHGFENEYEVRSSGVGVSDIQAGKVPTDQQIKYIKQALDRGNIFDGKTAEQVKSAITAPKPDPAVISTHYKFVQDRFRTEEHQYRREVLPKLGLAEKLKQGSDQTVADGRTVAFLAIDDRVHAAARDIFQKGGKMPTVMEVLGTYINSPPVTNTFGFPQKVYEAGAKQIVSDVNYALQRIVQETQTRKAA